MYPIQMVQFNLQSFSTYFLAYETDSMSQQQNNANKIKNVNKSCDLDNWLKKINFCILFQQSFFPQKCKQKQIVQRASVFTNRILVVCSYDTLLCAQLMSPYFSFRALFCVLLSYSAARLDTNPYQIIWELFFFSLVYFVGRSTTATSPCAYGVRVHRNKLRGG